MQGDVMRQLLDVLWKTVFFYLILLLLLRVTGKREVGSLNAIDLVGFIMISEAAIISIADGKIPLVVGVAPVVLLGALEWIFAYLSLKNQRVRVLVEGEPSIVVAHGKVNEQSLRKLRFNLSDLMSELRFRNIAHLTDVEFAVLETSGKLSVIPRAGARPTTADDLKTLGVHQADPASALPTPALQATVVMDGLVDEQALRRAGKDRAWLEGELRRRGYGRGIGSILVAAIDNSGGLTVQARENGGPEPRDRMAGGTACGDSVPPQATEAGATEPEGRRAASGDREPSNGQG